VNLDSEPSFPPLIAVTGKLAATALNALTKLDLRELAQPSPSVSWPIRLPAGVEEISGCFEASRSHVLRMCSADMIRDFVFDSPEMVDGKTFSSQGVLSPFPSRPKNLGIGTSSRGVPTSGKDDNESFDEQRIQTS
jgi:hypothetical protein